MKKLLFVIAFSFIGGQAFSQVYIATLFSNIDFPAAGCGSLVLVKVDPTGNQTTVCIEEKVRFGGLITLNQELNSILSQGYQLIETNYALDEDGGYGGLISNGNLNWRGATFIFAIPWSASGLEEVTTTLKSFIINPNPANTFVDISLDYSLNGKSEVVFINEAGYIAHKENVNNISKNEKYNVNISKIPTGKYLVTIVNGKTYTTPQKLIVK